MVDRHQSELKGNLHLKSNQLIPFLLLGERCYFGILFWVPFGGGINDVNHHIRSRL